MQTVLFSCFPAAPQTNRFGARWHPPQRSVPGGDSPWCCKWANPWVPTSLVQPPWGFLTPAGCTQQVRRELPVLPAHPVPQALHGPSAAWPSSSLVPLGAAVGSIGWQQLSIYKHCAPIYIIYIIYMIYMIYISMLLVLTALPRPSCPRVSSGDTSC